jgi:hypothetical protein
MAGISGIGSSPGIYARQVPPVGGPPRQAPGDPASEEANVSASVPNEDGESESSDELSKDEKSEVRELKQRDAEVRRHEQAHLAAAGQYARGGASFSYQRGPDGRQYAVGGEVSIDVGSERTPEATIRKAQIVRRAALAPAEPSPQDRSIAAQAGRLETQARRQLAEQAQETAGGTDTASPETASSTEAYGLQTGGEPAGARSLDISV